MTLTVTKQPDKVMLNKNPIVLGINTDNRYSSAGSKAVSKIQFLGGYPAADENFTITVDGIAYNYVFKNDASVNPALLQIKRNNTAIYAAQAAWVEGEIIPAVRRTLAIRENYDLAITFDGSFYYLNFTDKEFNSTHVIDIVTASTTLNFSNTAGSERVPRPNYKLYCDVWTTRNSDGTGMVKVASLEADPDTSGNGYFNIHSVLVIEDNERPGSVEYSDINAQVSLRYKLFYGEKYGDPITYYPAITLGQSTPLMALNGALSEDRWPYESFYTKTINAATPLFLNLHPRKLTVSRLQPLWLYYYYNHSAGGWRVRYKSYSTNGDTLTTTLSTSAINYTDQILALNVSAFDMGGDDPGVYKYEIWIEKTDGTVISETMTYIFSELNFEHNRYFFYRNSWGCYETIWCHGKAEYSKTFDFETAQVYVPPISTEAKAASRSYGSSFQSEIELSTGIKGREDKFDGSAYREYLTDFFNSDERYEITAGKMLPIDLFVKTEPFGSDTETIFAQTFKYKYSFKNKGYTPSWL